MTEFVIREATDEDGPALARLAASIAAGPGKSSGPAEGSAPRPEFERPAAFYAERGGKLWLVERDGGVAGSLGLVAHARPKEFELSMIGLDEETRGHGFATALLAGANAFAAASGGETLSVWIDAASEEAERFCERHGFVRQPGVRARPDGSDALMHHFTRGVTV